MKRSENFRMRPGSNDEIEMFLCVIHKMYHTERQGSQRSERMKECDRRAIKV